MKCVKVYYLSGKVETFDVISAGVYDGCQVLTAGMRSGTQYIPFTSVEKWEVT
jgi:hypothetical protein